MSTCYVTPFLGVVTSLFAYKERRAVSYSHVAQVEDPPKNFHRLD